MPVVDSFFSLLNSYRFANDLRLCSLLQFFLTVSLNSLSVSTEEEEEEKFIFNPLRKEMLLIKFSFNVNLSIKSPLLSAHRQFLNLLIQHVL